MADSIPPNNEEAPFDSRRFLMIFSAVVLFTCLVFILAAFLAFVFAGDSLQNSVQMFIENTPTP
jgi:hypothetical protein